MNKPALFLLASVATGCVAYPGPRPASAEERLMRQPGKAERLAAMPCAQRCEATGNECMAGVNEWTDAERVRVRYGRFFRKAGETPFEAANISQLANQQCAMRQQSCLAGCAMTADSNKTSP